jgi:DNA-binding MarR family transcriptional regulator
MSTDQAPTTPRDVLGTRLGYLFKHAQMKLAEEGVQALASHGINTRELAVLAVFADEYPLSQLEAAGRLGIDRTTMVALVDELERKGLVERHRSPEDRRKNVVELTDAGREAQGKGEQARKKAEDRFLAPLSEAEAAQLVRILQKLNFGS